MKILVDIYHPGHVHFFRHFIAQAQRSGHEVFITASDKDVTLDLMNQFKLVYHKLPSYGKSNFKKALNIIPIDLAMYNHARKVKPDIMMGIGSFRVAHVARLLGVKGFVFDDTEHASAGIALYRYFATKIFSPSCFFKNFGSKHVKYNGYHELGYLHPTRFQPDFSILKNAGIQEGERFFVVRFVAWEAAHDVGESGLSNTGKKRLVKLLSRYGRVLITSEYKLNSDFEPYRIKMPAYHIHHLLYYASMYIGEGGTMATESAVLGTPSIFISSLNAGTFTDLKNKYGLMYTFEKEKEAFVKIEELLEKGDLLKHCLLYTSDAADE